MSLLPSLSPDPPPVTCFYHVRSTQSLTNCWFSEPGLRASNYRAVLASAGSLHVPGAKERVPRGCREGGSGAAGSDEGAWPFPPQVKGAPRPDLGEGCSDKGPSATFQERPWQGHPGLPAACQVSALYLCCCSRDPGLARAFIK